MLVAVIMIFVVLSFTGVAVLDVSYNSRASSMETIENIKVQYIIESSINETLWKINTGVDSLVNTDVDGITTTYNADTQILTVSLDTLNTTAQISIDLSEDTHFNRGIAAQETITLSENDPGLNDTRKVRSNFQFMPDVDMAYYEANAVQTHSENGKLWSNNTFPNGIHIFTGNNITFNNIRLESGTMIFTGTGIRFLYGNEVTAPSADTTGAYAALIFTHPEQDFTMYSPGADESILGAIYCNGTITLTNGTVSGPVLAKNVILTTDFDILDDENPDYYQWTNGFGDRDNYDWPKQIDRWMIDTWTRNI